MSPKLTILFLTIFFSTFVRADFFASYGGEWEGIKTYDIMPDNAYAYLNVEESKATLRWKTALRNNSFTTPECVFSLSELKEFNRAYYLDMSECLGTKEEHYLLAFLFPQQMNGDIYNKIELKLFIDSYKEFQRREILSLFLSPVIGDSYISESTRRLRNNEAKNR